MQLPMFMQNTCNSGWYTSAMNYGMLSTDPWNIMNLHMNQLLDHSAAWQNMFNVPLYSFDNFMPYGNMYGNSDLTHPQYTLNQMSWGTPAWNNNNNMWNNCGNPWGNMGWNGGNTSGTSGNSGNLSAEEKGFQRKYNTLLSLVKQLKTYEGLSNAEKDALDVASRGTKGTWEEKYTALEEAYNKIDKDTVREFLVDSGHKVGVSKDIKGSAKNADSFYNRLLGTGFEYDDTDMDDAIDDFYDAIKTLDGHNGTHKDAEGLIALIDNGTYDILDMISSWNTNYKDTADASRVIDFIAKYYNEIDDKDQQKTAKSNILKPFVDTLISKAQSVKKSLDSDSKEAIETAISDVRTALNNTEERVNSGLSDAFDRLYLLTRQAAMAELRNDAKGYYGEIDSKVFNDKLFESKVVEDLKAEGFTESEIEDTEVKISEKKAKKVSHSEGDDDVDDGDDDKAVKDIDNKPAAEQVSIMKTQGAIEELTYKKDGTTTLYIEKTMTGDSDGDGKADYAKLFYINADGKLVEWTNTKLNSDGTGVEIVKTGVTQEEVEVTVSDIISSKKKTEQTEKEEKEKDATAAQAMQYGKDVRYSLYHQQWGGSIGTENSQIVANTLKKISNKENVLEFLNGYYSSRYPHEGLMERLDDDTENDIITIDIKLKFLDAVLEKAKDLGLDTDNNYTQLESLVSRCKQMTDAKNLDITYRYGIFCSGDTYGEAIDKQLQALHKKMKEQQDA